MVFSNTEVAHRLTATMSHIPFRFRQRVIHGAETALAHNQSVCLSDVFVYLGFLAASVAEPWTRGIEPYLTPHVQAGPEKVARTKAIFEEETLYRTHLIFTSGQRVETTKNRGEAGRASRNCGVLDSEGIKVLALPGRAVQGTFSRHGSRTAAVSQVCRYVRFRIPWRRRRSTHPARPEIQRAFGSCSKIQPRAKAVRTARHSGGKGSNRPRRTGTGN